MDADYRDAQVFYPQDEMTTILIPVTTGCSYNKCAFCSMYKSDKYEEVALSDIEMLLLNGYKYTEKVFLTGADPLAIGFDKMLKIIALINKYLPFCTQIASYAAIRTLAQYSVEELATLHDKGLRLLYIGFETGSDDVLKLMKKGHTASEAIKQARKLNAAKLQFNSIIMYGIAGAGKSVDNAEQTAKMLNAFITRKVITMSLMVFPSTELESMIKRGEFLPASKAERLTELQTLLEKLDPKQEMIFDTTHPTNIIKIEGKLPQDKELLIAELAKKRVKNSCS